MKATFVQKAYEEATNQCTKNDQTKSVMKANIDKFALRAFNCLAYNQEISGLFATNILFCLPEYYILDMSIKKVNLQALRKRFSRIIFGGSADEDVAKNFILFGMLRNLQTSKFDDYNQKGPELALYFFYDYFKTIIAVKDKGKNNGDISFAINHSNWTLLVQRPLKGTCKIVVALMGSFSINKLGECAVRGGHPSIDARQKNVDLILFALFVLWNQLPENFYKYNANLSFFQNLCWQI